MKIPKSKNIKNRILFLGKSPGSDLNVETLKAAREYIASYWPRLTRFFPKDDDSLIGLPKPYLVPATEKGHEFDFNELYYWDSYFIIQGILDSEHKKLVMGILDDLISLFNRFGIIPNASRTYLMGRSQPPLLSSFIVDVYKVYKPGQDWLKMAITTAKEEYQTVWMGEKKPFSHRVYEGLSRYYDVNYLDDLAEAESGWDHTPRFGRRALNYLPIDLNCMLYKYETDFADVARLLGKEKEATKWDQAAHRRKMAINRLMWSDMRNFYYDYNFVKEKRSTVNSLAAYFALWAGVASPKQAAKLVGALRKFEKKGGLAATDTAQAGRLMPGALATQWAYPNGWAPLHFIVVKGLLRYGYHEDARRVALKWLKTNLDWFNEHGVFLEKYNVVQPSKPPSKGLYPSQTGFGWTNSVFELFCQEFIDNHTPH